MEQNSENEFNEFNPDDGFDEKVEIEKLQEKIKQISEFNNADNDFITGNPELLQGEDDIPGVDESELVSFMESKVKDIDEEEESTAKKFVVTAEPENSNYFDKLSVSARSELFNELLAQYIKNEDKIKGKKRLQQAFIHFSIACATIVIVLPVAFYLVNKSIHLTVMNYKGAQANFEKLYESKGISSHSVKKHRN